MAKILIAEDERPISELVKRNLMLVGHTAAQAFDGPCALEMAGAERFDLVLLDVMLPGCSGFEVKEQLDPALPVIFVTAKNNLSSRLQGLGLGADDYIVKPFEILELLARVEAVLRRVHADSEPQREVLEFGELTIDVSGHKVLVNNEEIDLTASEFKLLTTLSRYPGRVYSRMELVEKVLGYDFEGYERTIDSHVKNLRAKIGDNPRSPKWLHTVHGVGYRFEDPTKVAQ